MVTAPHIFITNFLNCMKNIIDLSTECLEAGSFYKCGDYEVIVSKKSGDVYNVVIDKDDDTASCKGLNIEQIKSVLGLVVSGFQEPKWNPTERKDGIVRHSEFEKIYKDLFHNAFIHVVNHYKDDRTATEYIFKLLD